MFFFFDFVYKTDLNNLRLKMNDDVKNVKKISIVIQFFSYFSCWLFQ